MVIPPNKKVWMTFRLCRNPQMYPYYLSHFANLNHLSIYGKTDIVYHIVRCIKRWLMEVNGPLRTDASRIALCSAGAYFVRFAAGGGAIVNTPYYSSQ
jgi:hypothetical protein